MTTTSVEDYLKAIRELQRDKAQVTTCCASISDGHDAATG
jgi:Mn-dependent DtxR family transcriptional regulator